jgi:hypothetical protein
MTARVCSQKALLNCICASCFLLAPHAFAERQSMTCSGAMPSNHIALAEGDKNSANHLQLNRKIAPTAPVEIDVCAADLTVVGSKSGLLEVTVELGNPAPKVTAVDYVQSLNVAPEGAQLQLRLPRRVRAKVVVAVPTATPKLAVNLVSGDLTFETDRISGERKIDVVRGHVEIEGNPDSYATMHVSALIGSFYDHRAGHEFHGVLSQSLTGTGKGSVEVNVVSGRVDLKPWD